MIRGFYYSKEFNGDEHFAISVRDGRVGRWSNYEPAKIGDTVILWDNDNLVMGKITGDGKTDSVTWTGNHSFVAYPVKWKSATKRTEDVFPKKHRLDAWTAIRNKQESSRIVQELLGKVVNQFRPNRGPLDAFFIASAHE